MINDIITFVGKLQHNADGSVLGQAPVWVALGWHPLRHELRLAHLLLAGRRSPASRRFQRRRPRRHRHVSQDGERRGFVALSNGSRFGPSAIWATRFSPTTEVPLVGDFNADGRDDIMTVVRDGRPGEFARDIYVAYSTGSGFGPKMLWHSVFAGGDDIPMVIHHSGQDRNTITLAATDDGMYFSDVIAFRKNGAVSLALSLSNVPFPSGAPWERYKWFPEKGNGAALFPEWIWTDPAGVDPVRCLAGTQAFHLGGLAGVGGDGFFTSSVRSGGRQGHVLEELGHSVYAQCLNPSGTVDILGVHEGVYVTAPTLATRGLGALAMPGCPGGEGMYDCRDPEHYFISLQQVYRLRREEFRSRIRSLLTTAAARQTLPGAV